MNQPESGAAIPPAPLDAEAEAAEQRPVQHGQQPRAEQGRVDDDGDGDDEHFDDEDDDRDDDEREADGDEPRRQRAEPAEPPAPPIRFADVVSGQFDEQAEGEPVAKRVLAPQAETPKLHKVLAQAGLGSRLEMEQLIMEGRISVNNEPAHIGQRIQFGDSIKVNGKPIRVRIAPPPPRVIAYHKPTGEVVTHDDPQNRPTVFRKLPRLQQGKWQSVGRLDLNTEGLLLFTNSGELANKLMHPRFGLEREYAVRILGTLSNENKQRLLDGIELDDGRAQFGTVEEGGGEGANNWYRVTISEGRNREVRRLFEALGHAVSRLIRIRYGAMMLPRGLKRGAFMELDERDIRSLMQAAGDSGGNRGPRTDRPADGDQGSGNSRNRRRRGARGGNGAPQRGQGGPGQGAQGGGNTGQGQQQRRKDRGGDRGGDRQGGDRQGASNQPDPMKTSLGYIGADSFTRQRSGQGGPGGPRRGGGGGGGFGGGGSGGNRRGGRGR